MKGFRTICFIHSPVHSYEVCYLKQFFKWIGFSYLTYTPNSVGVGMDILKKPENQGFDIVVSLNQEAQKADASIAEFFNHRFIDLSTEQVPSEEELLKSLIEKICRIVLDGQNYNYNQGLLDRLADIYIQNHLVKVLYEYTVILMKDIGKSFFTETCNSTQKAISQLEELRQQEEANGSCMAEYLLFARFSCQRRLNELWRMRRWMPEYPVPQMLKELDGIYQYDKDFYRVEFLKAKVAEQDIMHSVYAKGYYHKAIEACDVELCKSYLFYQLGKWLDSNEQIYTSGQAYYRAYECNPTNIKAIFKLVVDAKRKKAKDLERKYLQLLIRNWEAMREYQAVLPLMDLEYAYKAYMLLDDLDRTSMQDMRFYEEAKKVLDFAKDLYLQADEGYFVSRLYGSDETGVPYDAKKVIERVCLAIASRMDINCKEIKGTEGINNYKWGREDETKDYTIAAFAGKGDTL